MSYKLIIHPKAEKEFNKIQTGLGSVIIKKIYDLAENPFPVGYKKLSGIEPQSNSVTESEWEIIESFTPSNKKL